MESVDNKGNEWVNYFLVIIRREQSDMSVIFSLTGHRYIADSCQISKSETFQSEEYDYIWTVLVLIMEDLFVVLAYYFIKVVQVSLIQVTFSL